MDVLIAFYLVVANISCKKLLFIEILTLMSLVSVLSLITRLAIIPPFLPVTVNPRILCFGKVCFPITT